MPRPRRFFPPEYKAEVVELISSSGKTVGQVARELDLTETAVRQWVRQAELDAGRRTDGLTMAEREELGRLRREVRGLARGARDPAQGRGFLRLRRRFTPLGHLAVDRGPWPPLQD
jgi:transposase